MFSKHHFRKSSGICVKDPISKPDCSCFTKLIKEAHQLIQLQVWIICLQDYLITLQILKPFLNGLVLAYTWIKANQGSKRLYLLSEVKGKPFLALFDLVKKVSLLFMQKLRRPGTFYQIGSPRLSDCIRYLVSNILLSSVEKA